MTDMNHVTLIGRVVKDATITKYANDTQVTNFTIVVNRDRKIGEQWEEKSIFVDLALFGKTAESFLKFLTKGKVIGVEGHLDMDKWEKDGKNFSKLKVSCEKVYPFISGASKKTDAQETTAVITPEEDYQENPLDEQNAIF